MKIPSILYLKKIILGLFCICCIPLTLVVSGCGDDYSSSDDGNNLSNTGSYACSIKWPEDVPTLESKSTLPRAIDCDAAGVATVAFTFYDGSGSYLTGDEWSCSLHEGTVYGIPAGTNRRLVVTGKDASGAMLYWGEETGITIVAGQTTQGGEIEMEYVYGIVPSIPTNVAATAGDQQVTISWDTVTGATSYNIYWSISQGVTKETGTKISTSSSPYTHTGLTNGTTYYYVITAQNDYGESDESGEFSATPAAGQAEEWEMLVGDTRLTSDSAASHVPDIAVDGFGNVHIAWVDYRDGNAELYYTKLDSNGNTLVDDTRLTNASNYSVNPNLEVDDAGNIHIAWQDDRDGNWEIYYTKLDNSGNTLVDDTRLTHANGESEVPDLEIGSAGNIYVAWQDKRNGGTYYDIYYTKLDNSGSTLLDDTRANNVSGTSEGNGIVVDNFGNIHIAWRDNRGGDWEIYYTKLDNNGAILVDDTRLTYDSGESWWPSLEVDSSANIHIVWPDDRDGNPEIYYAKVDNNGNTVVDDTRLTNATGESRYKSSGVDSSDNIHIAWYDERTGNGEIYYTKLDNNGNTLVDDTSLTYTGSAALYGPRLGVDSFGNIHITWPDNRDGNDEIYYTKGRTEGATEAAIYLNTVIDIISVGDNPSDVAISPDGGTAYVGNFDEDTVSVIRTSDNTVIDTISVGSKPSGITATPDGSTVYVANMYSSTISVIRTSDNTVIDTISMTNKPCGFAVTPDGSYLYVSNCWDTMVSVIQTSDNTVVDTISVGNNPGCAITPNGSFVYIANDPNTVSVIQTSDNTVVDTISVGNNPGGSAFTPDGNYVYVINNGDDTVSVIRTSDNSVIDTISVGNEPWDGIVTPNGSFLYVTNHLDDTVSVIQTSNNAVIDTISVGDYPNCVTVAPDGSSLFVTNSWDDTVSVIGFSE